MILFLGPLVLHYLDGVCSLYFDRSYWRANLKNIIWLRNHLVAPFSEELTFRACMIPILKQHYSDTASILICPVFFGIAHLHHIIDRLKLGYSLKYTLSVSVFQLLYTTLFGIYSAFLFVRTGHFVAPFIVHAFCNHMGFPDFEEALAYEQPKRSILCQLLELLPKLHNDLIKGKIETLQNYIVSIHGMPTPTLSNNLSTKIIAMMCATAASAVKLQCGREYGFSEVKLRATDLSLLSDKDLEGLPTNNLVAERDFSRFDREARVAKSRNRRFKAKNIQNNMVLYKCSKEIKIDKLSRTLAAILSCREAQWDVLQHEKLKTRHEAKLNKSKKSEDYTKMLLQNRKSWRGPCTSLEELQQILKEKSDQNIQIVKTELA
ncbi:CAAX prenyl protease 2 [Nymphon striatum]|nr:CAAX prenyl protease 2 [Nymphon striatum]